MLLIIMNYMSFQRNDDFTDYSVLNYKKQKKLMNIVVSQELKSGITK